MIPWLNKNLIVIRIDLHLFIRITNRYLEKVSNRRGGGRTKIGGKEYDPEAIGSSCKGNVMIAFYDNSDEQEEVRNVIPQGSILLV